jgi:serine/threonine-protein kinase
VTELLNLGHSNAFYAAKHKPTDKAVGLKIMLSNSDSMEVKRSMFAAKSLARINHPNVVAISDFGMTAAGLPYTVMGLIVGRTMQAILKEDGTLSAPRLRRLFGQVCLGMEAVHAKNIVHRDLKPANFLISNGTEEKVTIIDFGVCRSNEAPPPGLTSMGEIVGTPFYMSPEACTGEPADQRSDIYALGCSMFEAMTGAKPFVGDTMIDTMSRHISDQPEMPDGLAPELKGLSSVVLKCLEKKAQDRYQSMSELHRALSGKETSLKPAQNLRNLD